MFFSEVPMSTLLILMLPAVINLWGISHVIKRDYPNDGERNLWLLLCVGVPVIGGIVYFLFGRKRGVLIEQASQKNTDNTHYDTPTADEANRSSNKDDSKNEKKDDRVNNNDDNDITNSSNGDDNE